VNSTATSRQSKSPSGNRRRSSHPGPPPIQQMPALRPFAQAVTRQVVYGVRPVSVCQTRWYTCGANSERFVSLKLALPERCSVVSTAPDPTAPLAM
jgi:hypothetical protein